MSICHLWVLCLFLITCPVMYAQQVYEHLKVQKIQVRVSDDRDEKTVLSRLKTKEGALFSQEDFDDDLKTLAKEFDRIDPKLQVTDGQLSIQLQLWVKPTIHAIIWKGNEAISTDKLSKELGIKPGAVFDRMSFNKAFHKLKSFYIRRGYFESELDYTVERSDNQIDITIHIKEGRSGRIEKIVFENATKNEIEELSELIFTKEYSLFTSWLTKEGTHNPEVLKQDELTIVNYLQNEGYADAQVKTSILPGKRKDRIIIKVDIDRGEIYHVGSVAISGNTIFTQEDLLKKLPVSAGSIYSPEKARSSVKLLQGLYGSKGYIDASISQEATLVEGKREYDLQFRIQEGDKFRVGLIKVFGNTRTDSAVILHEIPLTPGDVFDSTLLPKAEERLLNTRYFKNVNFYAIKSSRFEAEGVHFRDVYVEVEENPTTAQFRFGVGINTTEGASANVSWSETNFNSKGLLTLLTKGFRGLRGGGEFVGANVTVGKKELMYNLSWTKPYFLDTPWIVGFDATRLRNEYSSRDYTIRSNNLSVFGNYPINAFVKAGVQYRIDHSFIRLRHIHHSKRNAQLIRESKNGGLISAVSTSLFYDSTDHPVIPKRGLRSTLSVEYAGLGGDHTFLKEGYLNSFYWAPYQYGLFRFRGNLQFIQTLGSTHPRDLPLAERLYLGGENSIRGYRFNTVGPKFRDSDHTARGGVSSILLSCEYDQYLLKKLDGFVFFDAGNVYFKQLYLGDLRYSAGYGIKLKVFGDRPLVLGMGYPLNPKDKNDVKHFFLSIGTSF